MSLESSNTILPQFAWLRLKEFDLWTLLLHENQSYIGRAVIWLHRPGSMQRLSTLRVREMQELFCIMSAYESALVRLTEPDHMNYAWLGNYFHEHGGHGHMHMIPRYDKILTFKGEECRDRRWGKNYAPAPPNRLPREHIEKLRDMIKIELSA